jgi:hypothetical protein
MYGLLFRLFHFFTAPDFAPKKHALSSRRDPDHAVLQKKSPLNHD